MLVNKHKVIKGYVSYVQQIDELGQKMTYFLLEIDNHNHFVQDYYLLGMTCISKTNSFYSEDKYIQNEIRNESLYFFSRYEGFVIYFVKHNIDDLGLIN